MTLTYTDLGTDLRRIELSGRLDLAATNSVDVKFHALVATRRQLVIVDLANVDFMASLGLAMLVRAARAVRLREGNMVLLAPRPNVEEVLISTGLSGVLAVCRDLQEAESVLRSMPPMGQ